MDPRGENLIRILNGKAPAWSNGDILGSKCWFSKKLHPLEKISKETFTAEANDPVSVFVAGHHLVEVEVVAAKNLTRSSSPKEPATLLRIPSAFLAEAGVSIDPTPGDTGVASIDRLHRDLFGAPDAFERLTRALLLGKRNGLDVVRLVSPATLCRVYESFSDLPANEISDKRKKKALELSERFRQFQGS